MEILLHRERMEMGEGPDGPRTMIVFTISLPRVVAERTKTGPLTVETKDAPPINLPYIIWPVPEQGRTRYRWARRHRGKPEMRLGISTHGAEEDLRAAVGACLDNHFERAAVVDV